MSRSLSRSLWLQTGRTASNDSELTGSDDQEPVGLRSYSGCATRYFGTKAESTRIANANPLVAGSSPPTPQPIVFWPQAGVSESSAYPAG